MGSYIYKVSLKRTVKALNAPAPIHVSTYAYKPYGRAHEDDLMERQSGAGRCQKDWAKDRSRNVHIVHAHSIDNTLSTTCPNPVICLPDGCCGTIWDGIYQDDKYLVPRGLSLAGTPRYSMALRDANRGVMPHNRG